MARPESINDLNEYLRDPIRILSVPDMPRLATLPRATVAVGALLDVLREAGATIGTDGNVYLDRSPEELAQKLAEAQRAWDANKAIYQRWADGSGFPTYPNATQAWAKAEGLPPMVEKEPEPEVYAGVDDDDDDDEPADDAAPAPELSIVVAERPDLDL